jgi:uncharacterized protein (TIGR01244 family)
MRRLFFISMFATIAVVILAAYFLDGQKAKHGALVQVAHDLFITSQLQPDDFRRLSRRGIRTVVDIRPDGEAGDQPSSAKMEQAAQPYHIAFHYIPVPHENIPDEAVSKLGEVLSARKDPAVLYCRTGRRAVRLLALAQAAQVDGPGADSILTMVRTAGFTAEDLKDQIVQRISQRHAEVMIKTE